MATVPEAKDNARERRLKVSFGVEEKIAKEWRAHALKECDDSVRAYWVCRQEAGLAVVFKCREHAAAMNDCITAVTNRKDEFDAYRDRRLREMEEERARAAAAAGK